MIHLQPLSNPKVSHENHLKRNPVGVGKNRPRKLHYALHVLSWKYESQRESAPKWRPLRPLSKQPRMRTDDIVGNWTRTWTLNPYTCTPRTLYTVFIDVPCIHKKNPYRCIVFCAVHVCVAARLSTGLSTLDQLSHSTARSHTHTTTTRSPFIQFHCNAARTVRFTVHPITALLAVCSYKRAGWLSAILSRSPSLPSRRSLLPSHQYIDTHA